MPRFAKVLVSACGHDHHEIVINPHYVVTAADNEGVVYFTLADRDVNFVYHGSLEELLEKLSGEKS